MLSKRSEVLEGSGARRVPWHRAIAFGSLGLLACALLAFLATDAALPSGSTVAVAGVVGPASLLIMSAVLLAAGTALALVSRGRWRWLAVITGAPALLAGLLVAFIAPTPVVALNVDGCTSPYVVDESWGSGAIYRQSGLLLEQVAYLVMDDGYRPVSSGGYRTERGAAGIHVWYFQSSPNSGDRLPGPPAMTLPTAGVICD